MEILGYIFLILGLLYLATFIIVFALLMTGSVILLGLFSFLNVFTTIVATIVCLGLSFVITQWLSTVFLDRA